MGVDPFSIIIQWDEIIVDYGNHTSISTISNAIRTNPTEIMH